MNDRLALIKARHIEAGGGNGDLAWLLAEVERLEARNAERSRELQKYMWRETTILEARDRAEAEVSRLRARVAELEAFAEPILRAYTGSNTAQAVEAK